MELRFLVSPAKKMNVVDGPPYATDRPALLDRALVLAGELDRMGEDELRGLWRCSEALARLNCARVRTLLADMQRDPSTLTAAVLSFEGIQYSHLAPSVMTEGELDWLGRSLRILSGLYGVLRPFDGVTPYRLEMQARLEAGEARNLYEFWGDIPFREVVRGGCDAIVNVASVEYARAVVPAAEREGMRVVTCLFGSVRDGDGRFLQRATEAKAARGTFVRWCAENDVRDVGRLGDFAERGYSLDPSRSEDDLLVFVRT